MTDKIGLMCAAASLTVAATGVIPSALSPDLKDNAVRAKNLQVWETFRAYYVALTLALADTTNNWPDPPAPHAPPLAPVISVPTPLGPLPIGPVPGIGGSPTPPAA